MVQDWTRNLSRHRASAGGSCFIAWRRTVEVSVDPARRQGKCHTGHLDIVAGLDAARVGANTVSIVCQNRGWLPGRTGSRQTYCFGAVVLTWGLSAAGRIEQGQQGGREAYLERDGRGVGVLDLENLCDLDCKGAWLDVRWGRWGWLRCPCGDARDLRWKPSSAGSISTDMVSFGLVGSG